MNYCQLRIAPRDFPDPKTDIDATTSPQHAVLAAGCFWCVEALFDRLDGVISVTSGYAGGSADTADYQSVCSGATNHAEVVRVEFDPARVSFGQLLKVFFSVAHDPTQLDGQGNDRGRQYRSAIFYADPQQQAVASAYIKQLGEARIFDRPIVTTLEALEAFHEAELYHQDYAARNPNQGYIAQVSTPKVNKLVEEFPDRLKKAAGVSS